MARTPPPPRPPKKDKYVLEGTLPEIDVTEHTPAFLIFNRLYDARVPQMFTETIQAMQTRQVRGNEHGTAGVMAAGELAFARLSIVTMTELMLEGATITLVNPGDAKEIYETVRDHLRNWLTHVDVSLNTRAVPAEDLRNLDMFAGVIYPYARPDLLKGNSNHLLAQLFGRSRSSIFSRHNVEEQKARDELATGSTEVPLSHNPMMDALALGDFAEVKSKWT